MTVLQDGWRGVEGCAAVSASSKSSRQYVFVDYEYDEVDRLLDISHRDLFVLRRSVTLCVSNPHRNPNIIITIIIIIRGFVVPLLH